MEIRPEKSKVCSNNLFKKLTLKQYIYIYICYLK